MTSATKVKFDAIYEDTRYNVALPNMNIKASHNQPATPIKTDKWTTSGISNKITHKKISKSIYMNFNGLKIECRKTNSIYFRGQATWTLSINTPNIIQACIIKNISIYLYFTSSRSKPLHLRVYVDIGETLAICKNIYNPKPTPKLYNKWDIGFQHNYHTIKHQYCSQNSMVT